MSGYEFPPQVKERVFVVLLHSALFHPRSQLRYEATTKLLAKSGISHEVVGAVGETALAQALGLILFGDYTSFYLAILNKVDPTPIDAIDFVKQYLNGRR